MARLGDRFKSAWDAFWDKEHNKEPILPYDGPVYSYDPMSRRMNYGNDRSIVAAIYNRIANDVASIDIEHVKLDQNGTYKEAMNSEFNKVLTSSANLDQTHRAFIFDLVMSMFDEGVVASVITKATADPRLTESYDIEALRVGKVVTWRPTSVTLNVYNEKTGQHEDITYPKYMVAIHRNPFYSVMNERGSVSRRLIEKLNLLDVIDKSGSGKLDLIIQLPYGTRGELQKKRARERRQELEDQLVEGKYGIAYADASEHITQLNRPVENNLMSQIEYLTSMLYSQLGITQEILNGTAGESTMLNYYNRTIEPILAVIVDEYNRKFLSTTARSQRQAVWYHRDPFKLVPVSQIADIADKFTRNEILSSNELRSIIGFKPVDDPAADELRNKNLNQSTDAPTPPSVSTDE